MLYYIETAEPKLTFIELENDFEAAKYCENDPEIMFCYRYTDGEHEYTVIYDAT